MKATTDIIIDAAARIAAEDRAIAARAQAEGLDFGGFEPIEITAAALASRIVDAARAELERHRFSLSEAEECLTMLATIRSRAEFAPATFAADPVDACRAALGLTVEIGG
jgi:hypothetical protein